MKPGISGKVRKHTFSGFPAIQLLKNQRLTWSGIFVNIFTLNFATLTFNKAYSRCPVTSCGKIFTKKYIYLAIWKQRKHLSRIVLILLTFFLSEVFSFEDTHFPKSILIFLLLLVLKLFRQMLELEIQIAWIYCTGIETVLAILKPLLRLFLRVKREYKCRQYHICASPYK